MPTHLGTTHETPPGAIDVESNYSKYGSMKTTVDIPDRELKDAIRFTRAKTKREAIVRVIEEFNQRQRITELTKYAGTFADAFPANAEIEAVDAERDRRLRARPRR